MAGPLAVVRDTAQRAGRSAGAVTALASGGLRGVTATVRVAKTMSDQVARAIDLHIKTLQAAQPVIAALARSIDEGLIDDLRGGLRALDTTATMLNRMGERLDEMSAHLEQTMEPVRETAAAVRVLMNASPAAQANLNQAGQAMERMVGLMAPASAGFDLMPGVKQAREAFTAATALTPSSTPEAEARSAAEQQEARPKRPARPRRPRPS